MGARWFTFYCRVGDMASNFPMITYLTFGVCRDFLGAVSSVGKDDLERIGWRYFSDLFDPGKSSCSVCCSPGKLQEVKAAFEE